MNFGIEILTIYSVNNTQNSMNIIYGIKQDVIYWVAETYLVITLRIRWIYININKEKYIYIIS